MPEELARRSLRTFFVGTETSQNPLIPKLREVAKQLAADEMCDGPGMVSARYGKRVIINIQGSQLAALKDTDFVEIVDYDGQKNRCLLMGRAEPAPEAGVHWLIFSNREEVGGIVHIRDPLVLEVQEATRMFPETKEGKNAGNIEVAVETLKALRKSQYVVLKGRGSIAVGRTVDEALAVARDARAAALQVVAEAEAEGPPGEDELAGMEPGPPPPPRRR
ncbi:MAG: class II aldolase/adducin family protein [Halobacteriales archaeon]|nr:class II aldolase/adducin family protein [Halobacteriales archaeon]